MAEQTDIDLDSVIDRLLEGESMFHLTTNLSTSPIALSLHLLPHPLTRHPYHDDPIPSTRRHFVTPSTNAQSEETDLEKLSNYKSTKSSTSAQKHVKSLLVSQSSSSSKLLSRSVVCRSFL